MWNSSLVAITPAASLLTRCVSAGAVSEDEINAASSDQSTLFSTHLQEAEEQIKKQKQLYEVQLQLELLKVDEQGADVFLDFHLDQKNNRLQMFANHLLDLLREQKVLRQRLMRPLARTNLPVLAHLHSLVVKSIELMVDIIVSLEEKLRSAQSQASTTDCLSLLDTSCSLMLTLSAEMETLSNQVVQRRRSSSAFLQPVTELRQ